jgi:hypothetical protein
MLRVRFPSPTPLSRGVGNRAGEQQSNRLAEKNNQPSVVWLIRCSGLEVKDRAPVAQRIEQRPPEPCVGRSIRLRRTNHPSSGMRSRGSAEIFTCQQRFDGSADLLG